MAHASSLRFSEDWIRQLEACATLFFNAEPEEALAVGDGEVNGGLGEVASVEGGEGGFVEVEGFPGL